MATDDRTAALDTALDALLWGSDAPAASVTDEEVAMLRRLHEDWLHPAPAPAFVRRLGANLASLHGRAPAAGPPTGAVLGAGVAPSPPTVRGSTGEAWVLPHQRRWVWMAVSAIAVCVAFVGTALLSREDERRTSIPAAAVASPPAEGRAVVLMIDVSGSMSYDPLGGAAKIDTVKTAAQSVLVGLAPGDWFGVLAFNDQLAWAVPLGPLAAPDGRGEAETAIEAIRAEGGTEIYPAFLAAIEALNGAVPAEKHLIVLSDGKSRTGTPEQYRAAAESAAARGITISTIAIGADADTDLMQTLAEVGGGRYHYAERSEDILPGVEVILRLSTATPESGWSGFAPGAATPDPVSNPPVGVRSNPIAHSITVDVNGLLSGDATAKAAAIEQLRSDLAPIAAAGCRIGFVISEGSAPDIGTGNAIADAVNALLRDEFPGLVVPEGTGFYSFANVGAATGSVNLLLFPNVGCEAG